MNMTVNPTIWMAVGIIVGFYIMYKLFFLSNKVKVDDDYQKTYNKVLTSDEYKVKSQYDK
jgi:hypothetical protein